MSISSDEAKAARERSVFDLFLRLSKYDIRSDTIRSGAPDFGCTLANGEAATFELVTLDSEKSSKVWGDYYSTSLAWADALAGLPEDQRTKYLDNFSHAVITPRFAKRRGPRDMRKLATAMLTGLSEQPKGVLGRIDFEDDFVLVEPLPTFGIRGPMMTDSMSPDIRPVDWTRIRAKVAKNYRIAGIFELIAYSYRDTLFHQEPEDAQCPTDEIRRWLKNSPFRRVWIVECRFKQIYRRIDRPN